MTGEQGNLSEWFSRFDIEAIEDASNKIPECAFFLKLAEREPDRQQFRWLVSAFFNAAYSYFEMSALHAYNSFVIPDSGETVEDPEILGILGEYVGITRRGKNKGFVKTEAKHHLIRTLYELRRGNTHHFPLAITASGITLPEDYQFGRFVGDGIPSLQFCRQVMELITKIDSKINE